MKKEEILEKSKKRGTDEREEMIETESSSLGSVTILGMIWLFAIWNLLHGEKSYELLSIFCAYGATTSFSKYNKLRGKKFLFVGIIGVIVSIGLAVAYLLGAR